MYRLSGHTGYLDEGGLSPPLCSSVFESGLGRCCSSGCSDSDVSASFTQAALAALFWLFTLTLRSELK